jgi:magnesium transporter
MANLALSELLGAAVVDPSGAFTGRVREVALAPQDDPSHLAALIVRTASGDRMVRPHELSSVSSAMVQATTAPGEWQTLTSSEGFLLLDRDLMDQQIIDVHGRKVVRVNDVEIAVEQRDGYPALRISEVDVGPRGAVRRLLRGIVPRRAIHRLVRRLTVRGIPWQFVDLIETDPARRVRLKIAYERLAKLHPADIADILEELAPAQREAVFESLDEDVAADALEEIDPKLQKSLLESLDSDHAADIVEEMDPDAAANLLGDLPEERTEEILGEMEPEEREDVEELLEFQENTAAGHMTTDYLACSPSDTVHTAIELLRKYEGGVETINTVYLVTRDEKLVGAVPLAKIALAPQGTVMQTLSSDEVISCLPEASEHEVAELFDKYNLMSLPVVDHDLKMSGVITADDVISILRREYH